MLNLVSKLDVNQVKNDVNDLGYGHYQETTDETRLSGVFLEGKAGHGFRAGYFTPDGDWSQTAQTPQVAVNQLRLRLRRESLA